MHLNRKLTRFWPLRCVTLMKSKKKRYVQVNGLVKMETRYHTWEEFRLHSKEHCILRDQ